MRSDTCEFEAEALAAAANSGHVDADLQAHIAACPICSDVMTVAGAIEDAREDLRLSALVPDSGRVWWLAQVRARREAAETAARPITAVQAVAFACAVALLGACFGATSAWFQSVLKRVVATLAHVDLKPLLLSASALLAEHGALILATAIAIFLIPAAVYLALGRD